MPGWLDPRAARTEKYGPRPRDGAWFERFEFAGVHSGRATKYPGKSTEAALPTWDSVQFVSGVGISYAYMVTSAGEIPRAAPPKFAMGSPLACGQLRREIDNGDPAVVATSLTWCAGVGLRCLLGGVRRGATRWRRFRRSASPNFFAGVAFVCPRCRFPRRNNKCDFAETATSPNYGVSIG